MGPMGSPSPSPSMRLLSDFPRSLESHSAATAHVGYSVVADEALIAAAATALGEIDDAALATAVEAMVAEHAPDHAALVAGPVAGSMVTAAPAVRPAPPSPSPPEDGFALKSGLSLLSAAVAASFIIV